MDLFAHSMLLNSIKPEYRPKKNLLRAYASNPEGAERKIRILIIIIWVILGRKDKRYFNAIISETENQVETFGCKSQFVDDIVVDS
jgi:hypothetical protein